MKFINHEFKRKNCRLCGSDNLKNVYSFNKNPVGDDYLKNYKKVNKYDLKLIFVKIVNLYNFLMLLIQK